MRRTSYKPSKITSMYSDLESDQRKREEVISSLYWSLMQNWDIPKPICDHYGFTEDYQLFRQLEELAPDEYKRKRETGEVPDILEVDARLTRTVEKVFESLCGKPPTPYLDKMNEELEKLGQIAALPDSVHDILHITPAFLVKYGIDKMPLPRNAPVKRRKHIGNWMPGL